MILRKKGEVVEVTITYLEMLQRPSFPRPPSPTGAPVAVIRADTPPPWYFIFLYRAVGAQYEWMDRMSDNEADLAAYVQDEKIGIFTLLRGGWPAGFFLLDWREDGVTDLGYFGLVPEAVGKGLGTWALRTAIHMGWDVPGTEQMTVNTCTLDHPRALPQYQKHGFLPVRQSTYTRVLSRDWDPATFP